MFGAKAEIAALEKGLDVELVMVAYESATGYQPRHPEVVRINPKQQVPVLVHAISRSSIRRRSSSIWKIWFRAGAVAERSAGIA